MICRSKAHSVLTLSLVFFLALGQTVAQSQDPAPDVPPAVEEAQIILVAPEKAEVGEVVIFDVSQSVASQVKWHVSPDNKNYVIDDNDNRLIFSSRTAGEYTITVAASFKDTVDLKVHRLVVGNPPPTPGPGPGPGPGPAPVSPLVGQVKSWAGSVKTDTAKAEARALAESFRSTARFIDSGIFKTTVSINEATKLSNRQALGGAIDNWKPFFDQLNTQLKTMSAAGELKDDAAHANTWRLIADGLLAFASE